MRKVALSSFILALFLLSPPLLTLPTRAEPIPLFQVAFIDVGQGDAILLRDGAGFDVLVDGGRPSAGPAVLAYLRETGVDDLEALVATHADQDHIGGLITVLEATDIPVEAALYNGYPGDTDRWFKFTQAVADEGLALTPAQSPQTLQWGRMSAQVLNPPPGKANPDQNDASIVLMVDFGEVEVLLTGDMEAKVEADLLTQGISLTAEVLKVAHHGSKSSSTAEFLAAVHPEIAVISTGPNPYGHPHLETLLRLSKAGARTLRTDLLGTVVVTSDGDTYSITPLPAYLPLVAAGKTGLIVPGLAAGGE